MITTVTPRVAAINGRIHVDIGELLRTLLMDLPTVLPEIEELGELMKDVDRASDEHSEQFHLERIYVAVEDLAKALGGMDLVLSRSAATELSKRLLATCLWMEDVA